MANDDRTRRVPRVERSVTDRDQPGAMAQERPTTVSDVIQFLRASIVEVRKSPTDPLARDRMRAVAEEHGLWEQLALLLADELRANPGRPEVAAAFEEELAVAHEVLESSPDVIEAPDWRAATEISLTFISVRELVPPDASDSMSEPDAGATLDDVNGTGDLADELARIGRGFEAAELLRLRVDQAVEFGGSDDEIAALRLRLATILEDACGDRAAASAVLGELLAASPDYLPAVERMTTLARGDADPLEAERRLRGILSSRRHHIDANLALVDLLSATGRLDAAAGHLRDTLTNAAAMPDDQRARLAHALATVMAGLGDLDESHQLLHEAHRLDRRSLPITLALGQSCFARKLWRQASLHLGAVAEHPDAARHASVVAAGLVQAAQAEIRALRPANAHKHLETAIRLDPHCAPAWRALAQAAREQGDLARAAEYLEREADSTTSPKDRLRLFEALGDLARDELGDLARAERCWTQIADAGSARVLEKLLAVQRKRGATIERGETCARLAALGPNARARKAFIEETIEAFTAGGAADRALPLADELIRMYPRDVDAVASASASASAAGDPKRAATWLRAALTAWDASGDRGDQDPRRADLWRRLGDADRALGDDQAALLAYHRAVDAAPDSDGALAARRVLVGLTSTSPQQQRSSLAAIVEVGQEPAEVLAWARSLARSDEVEDARAAFELAHAVGARLSEQDERVLATYPARAMAADESYACSLDEADRAALIDDPSDAPLGELLELLAGALPLLCPSAVNALAEANLGDATRLRTNASVIAALYPQIAKALGGPATLLYTTPLLATDLALLLASPPVVIVTPSLASVRAASRDEIDPAGDAALRFQLGRIVELSRPTRVLAGGQDAESFARFVAALQHAFGPPGASIPRDVATASDRLRTKLPVALRKRLADRLAQLSPKMLDPHAYRAACQRAADRAGLLVCGDVAIAIELAGGAARANHLVTLAPRARYLAVRRKLRKRGGG